MTARALDVGETCPRCRSRVYEGANGYGCGCDHADDDYESEDAAWDAWWAIRCKTCKGVAYPTKYDACAKPIGYRCRHCGVETSST